MLSVQLTIHLAHGQVCVKEIGKLKVLSVMHRALGGKAIADCKNKKK